MTKKQFIDTIRKETASRTESPASAVPANNPGTKLADAEKKIEQARELLRRTS